MGQERPLHGPVPDVVHIRAGQEIQSVAVQRILGDRQPGAGTAQPDHRFKHDAPPLLDVLAHGVQVRGKVDAGGENALAVLALALAVKLLPPLAHKAEGGIVAGQHLYGPSGLVKLIPGGGIPPGRAVKGGVGADLHHVRGALHQFFNGDPRHRDGQQAHGGEHGVPAAHGVRHHKGLPALCVGQGLQRPPGLVRGGIDALSGFLPAVLLFQHLPEEPEGHGRLRGGAGLGDHIDGKVNAVQEFQHLLHGVGRQAVAHEVDVGGVLLFLVVVGGAEALDHAPGSQIGTADADDHQGLGILPDPGRGGLDAPELLLVIVPGQVDPARKRTSGAGAVLQLLMGQLHAGR